MANRSQLTDDEKQFVFDEVLAIDEAWRREGRQRQEVAWALGIRPQELSTLMKESTVGERWERVLPAHARGLAAYHGYETIQEYRRAELGLGPASVRRLMRHMDLPGWADAARAAVADGWVQECALGIFQAQPVIEPYPVATKENVMKLVNVYWQSLDVDTRIAVEHESNSEKARAAVASYPPLQEANGGVLLEGNSEAPEELKQSRRRGKVPRQLESGAVVSGNERTSKRPKKP